MKLFETLKQFKNLGPDADYAARSKRAILAMPQREPRKYLVRSIFEAGIAVALAGFFVLLITNGFSSTSYLTPVEHSVIDSQVLTAEAQAVDIQIKLANLTYDQSQSSSSSATTQHPATATTLKAKSILGTAGTTTTSTETSTVSLDDALTRLAE